MTATLSTDKLPAEVALVSRIIHEEAVQSDLFNWLRNPKHGGKCPHSAGVLAIAIEELIGPIARDADDWLSNELKHASVWYGFAIERYVHKGCPAVAKRQVLTALLPLYRCLATGELSQSFSISRHRLAEIHFIAAMQEVLGQALTDLLETSSSSNESPDATIVSQLDLDLGQATSILMDVCSRSIKSADLSETYSWLAKVQTDDFEHDIVSWAEAPLLWRLAGEVIDKKPNTVLPRSWADVPVPWPSVTNHWRRIEAEIDRLLAGESPSDQALPPIEIEHPTSAVIAPKSVYDNPGAVAQSSASSGGADVGDSLSIDQLADALDAELSETVELTNAKSDASVSQATEESPDHTDLNATEADDSSGPCYSTAEVHNHNDPVFLNAVNRKIAVARKEHRSLSLATIVVLPDGEPHVDFFETGTDGIKRWQSRLIDNLSSHPEMPDTACFVTGEGQVIATAFDLDRGLATEVFREAIVETLSGGEADSSSLMKADVPVRFHVGIATAPHPGPNLSANELIAPSQRCFTAASSQGGASIKSIEVY
ncbi:MAG: hypothetical protein Aurels2KO_38640 [Aureliella sp.]